MVPFRWNIIIIYMMTQYGRVSITIIICLKVYWNSTHTSSSFAFTYIFSCNSDHISFYVWIIMLLNTMKPKPAHPPLNLIFFNTFSFIFILLLKLSWVEADDKIELFSCAHSYFLYSEIIVKCERIESIYIVRRDGVKRGMVIVNLKVNLMTTQQLMMMLWIFLPSTQPLPIFLYFLFFDDSQKIVFEYILLWKFNKARGSDCFLIVKWKIPERWIVTRSSCLTRYDVQIYIVQVSNWNVCCCL